MEGTVMEKGSSFISDKISSKSTQKDKKVVRVDAEKVEIGKVQAPEVSSTSLYIRRNSSLNQLLTKTPLEPLTLPTSPLEKMNLQGRWTEFPSPLPMPPVGSMDENGQSHHKDMPIRMKSLPSFGFKIGKLAETSLSCRKKRPMSRGSSGSPARRKTGGRGPPAVVPIKNRQRRRRTALTAIPKMAQSSLSNWVTHTDAGANSVMGGKCKSIQEQQRAILSTAYSVMQEENDRNRKALHEILNIVNRELIQKNECYRMLMRLRRESPNSENAADIVQLLTEVVVHGGDRPEEKQSGTLVECDKYEKRDQSTMTVDDTATGATEANTNGVSGIVHADHTNDDLLDIYSKFGADEVVAVSQLLSISNNAYLQYQKSEQQAEYHSILQTLDDLDIPICSEIEVQNQC